MTTYNLDKYDFKKYLLASLHDARQDQLIFWKNVIPLPLDIVYDIFEKRGILMSKYLDQLGAAYLHAWILNQNGTVLGKESDNQPSADNLALKSRITADFLAFQDASGAGKMLQGFAERLLLADYQPGADAFFQAICHEGKKYSRIYIPAAFKNEISPVFPEFLTAYGKKNGDFFAGVIADHLGIYRSGLGDALVAIFNKLIDFILLNATPGQKNYASTSGFRISASGDDLAPDLDFAKASLPDGSIWEPLYRNAASSFTLNRNHPFSSFFADPAKHGGLIVQLLTAMSKIEDETIKPSERKVIEKFRQDVSRELRLMIENNS